MKPMISTVIRTSRGFALAASTLLFASAAFAETDPAVVSAAKDFVAKASVAPTAWA